MKSSILQTVKLEKTVELKADAQTTKERMRLMGEECRSRLSDGWPLYYRFFNNGRMSITADNNYPFRKRSPIREKLYSVIGEVEAVQNKSVVKIYSVKNNSLVFFRVIYAIIFILAVGLLVADAFISGKGLSNRELVAAIVGIIGAVVIFYSTHTESTNSDADIKIMVEEIERRAVAVDHWDDLKPLDFD